jgi:Ca2+-binding RTX toxin-like protein
MATNPMNLQFNTVVPAKSFVPANSLVIIDAAVPDQHTLIQSLSDDIPVVVLDPQRDGVAQITEAIARYSKARYNRHLTSLHIVSHGAPGTLFLGNTELSLDTLSQYAPEIETWNLALSDPASILLYGCQVAAGDAGEQFITRLRSLTHAQIGASRSLTGNAALGGNWELEVTTGAVAPLAFNRTALATYAGVLTSVTGDGATWDVIDANVAESGNLGGSIENGFNGIDSLKWSINNQRFDLDQITESNGVVTASGVVDGMNVTIEHRVLQGQNGKPVLRSFLTLTNNSTTAATKTLKYDADVAGNGLAILGSSDGDTLHEVGDRYVITASRNPENKNPGINTLAFFGADAAQASIGSINTGSILLPSTSPNFVIRDYGVNLAPGASQSFIFYNSISATPEEAGAEAGQFADVNALANNGLLRGLTPAQLQQAGLDTSGLANNSNLVITPAASGTTTEAGGKATFNLALSRKPLETVTLSLISSDVTEGKVDKPTLTFTPDNWNQPQSITVTGVDDTIVDGNIPYFIQTSFSSGDAFYNSANPADIALTNTDNDVAPRPVPPPAPPARNETGVTLRGKPGKDTLTGTDRDDILFGNGGNDKLSGNGGNDLLRGGSNNDQLFGGAGSDRLNGDKGSDRLTGGEGNDIFAVSLRAGRDVVTDFAKGQDKIALTNLSFGQVVLSQSGADTLISSGGKVLATLKGVASSSLVATDFVK